MSDVSAASSATWRQSGKVGRATILLGFYMLADRGACPAPLLIGLTMAIGTVKWFNPDKGYGFIQPDGAGPDVFVHISAVEQAGMRTLSEGQKVSYEVLADRRTGKSSAGNLKAA